MMDQVIDFAPDVFIAGGVIPLDSPLPLEFNEGNFGKWFESLDDAGGDGGGDGVDGGDGGDGGGGGGGGDGSDGGGVGDDGAICAADIAAADAALSQLCDVAEAVGGVLSDDGSITLTVIGSLPSPGLATPNFADALVGAMAGAVTAAAVTSFVTGVAAGVGVVVSLPVTATIGVLGAAVAVVVAWGLANLARGGSGDGIEP